MIAPGEGPTEAMEGPLMPDTGDPRKTQTGGDR